MPTSPYVCAALVANHADEHQVLDNGIAHRDANEASYQVARVWVQKGRRTVVPGDLFHLAAEYGGTEGTVSSRCGAGVGSDLGDLNGGGSWEVSVRHWLLVRSKLPGVVVVVGCVRLRWTALADRLRNLSQRRLHEYQWTRRCDPDIVGGSVVCCERCNAYEEERTYNVS